MSIQLKLSVSAIVLLSLLISSCTTTRHTATTTEIPNSRKLISSHYNCTVHDLPSFHDSDLTVSFQKVNQYEFQEIRKEYEESDNGQTRVAGLGTMVFGALIAAAVAAGGTDDNGNHIEPNPEAGKGILIGGLIVGGIMTVIPDSKTELSSSTRSITFEEYEPVIQDSMYTIWSNIYPEKVISRTLVDEEINLDVVSELGLDYVENQDSIKVYFKSILDRSLIYTVDFLASDYLKRYLNTNELSSKVSLYQAPNTNSPIVGQLGKRDHVIFLEEKDQWYRATWNKRTVYLPADSMSYFFAKE